ncbi:MAG TPA: sigma-70 family RNA polymerase sigma factor [Myxococcaceae bacterium]|nr:sigma-70 family RNA polymerase sigma factor [Myxococcaceae bacterium]
MALGENRDVVLDKYGPYVHCLASTVCRQFHATLDLDELISWGQLGLFEAAERFNPKLGSNFLTFAHYRIKGAIFDGLRKMGVVLRGADARTAFVGERANAYLAALSDRESGALNPNGIGDEVQDISSAAAGLALVFATSFEAMEGRQIADEAMPADQRLEIEQLKVRLRAALPKLPEKERQLLEGYYFQGKTMQEAGGQLGQSKSWASRLHARAIERLKDMLDEEARSARGSERRSPHGGATGRGGGQPGRADRSPHAAGAKREARGQ